MIVLVDYASPSMIESTRDRASVAFSTNLRRPVRFHGIVRDHGFMLRIALRALGELIWSNDTWVGNAALLDPVITVHPDRIFFEAFSQDQSAYGALIVDPKLFDAMGEVVTGTTNMISPPGCGCARRCAPANHHVSHRPRRPEVKTASAGGRFENKVDLPETWVRGFCRYRRRWACPGRGSA